MCRLERSIYRARLIMRKEDSARDSTFELRSAFVLTSDEKKIKKKKKTIDRHTQSPDLLCCLTESTSIRIIAPGLSRAAIIFLDYRARVHARGNSINDRVRERICRKSLARAPLAAKSGVISTN